MRSTFNTSRSCLCLFCGYEIPGWNSCIKGFVVIVICLKSSFFHHFPCIPIADIHNLFRVKAFDDSGPSELNDGYFHPRLTSPYVDLERILRRSYSQFWPPRTSGLFRTWYRVELKSSPSGSCFGERVNAQ
jgi:hypothetical protein